VLKEPIRKEGTFYPGIYIAKRLYSERKIYPGIYTAKRLYSEKGRITQLQHQSVKAVVCQEPGY
jgi:hypothetical protein